jgi:hypothetical protein
MDQTSLHHATMQFHNTTMHHNTNALLYHTTPIIQKSEHATTALFQHMSHHYQPHAHLTPVSAYDQPNLNAEVHYDPQTRNSSESASVNYPVGNGCTVGGSVYNSTSSAGNNPGAALHFECHGW